MLGDQTMSAELGGARQGAASGLDYLLEGDAKEILRNESGALSGNEAQLVALPSCSDNPLVRAAARLLNLIPNLRATIALDEPERLHRSLVSEVRFFEQQALAENVPRDEIVGARYCLCTALDETAAQTPWGSRGTWARHSLLVTFHSETWGGEKYYQLLGRLAQSPDRHRHLIELLYYCIALGFEGRFHIVENGHAQLEMLKRRVATLINSARNGYEQRLSPHWRGEETAREVWRMIPPWVVAAVCALLAFVCYIGFSFVLAPKSDAVFSRLVTLELPALDVAKEMPRAVPPRLRRFLENEIRAGLLEVRDLADRSTVTLMGDGLFDTGSAEPRPRYLEVLDRIARALDEVDGVVVVSGYTDSVPMRSARFPSNWHLSEARASSVARMLTARMLRPDRVKSEGRGEAEPISSNDTAEGRARNRRVEITILLSGEATSRQLNSGVRAVVEEGRQ